MTGEPQSPSVIRHGARWAMSRYWRTIWGRCPQTPGLPSEMVDWQGVISAPGQAEPYPEGCPTEEMTSKLCG